MTEEIGTGRRQHVQMTEAGQIFSRTGLLLGQEGMERLRHARVAIFGLGGVGSYVVEALARSGVGTLDLIDHDKVSPTNINRQLLALHSTVGRDKVDVARERILDIHPDAQVHVYKTFYLPETAGQFDLTAYDYVADAIDTVTAKVELVCQAYRAGTPIISSMGTGNKLDSSALEVADLYETSVCPLARVMRRELKKRGIPSLKVIYSREEPLRRIVEEEFPGQKGSDPWEEAGVDDREDDSNKENSCGRAGSPGRHIPASNAFVPSVAGLLMAGEIIQDLAGTR